MEVLIQSLVNQTNIILPFRKTTTLGVFRELQLNAQSLVKLAKHKPQEVLQNVTMLYSQVLKDEEKNNDVEKDLSGLNKFLKSKLLILQLLQKVLATICSNDKIDLHLDDDLFGQGDDLFESVDESSMQQDKDDDVLIQQDVKEDDKKEQTVSDKSEDIVEKEIEVAEEVVKIPNIDPSTCETILQYCLDIIKLTDVSLSRVKNLAARVIFKLSIVQFDVVFKPVHAHIVNMKPDTIEPHIANLIEYICFDMTKLSKLMNLLNDSLVKWKTNAYIVLAEPIRAAIWNWMTNYPSQLISFTKNKDKQAFFREAPLNLFENYGNFTAKKLKDNVAWPVMTMLLMLAPEAFDNAIMGYKQNLKTDTKRKEKKFVTTLAEAIKKDKTSDTPAICFVDLFKVSSYISKNDMKSLRFLAAEVQPAIQEKLIVLEGTPVKKDGKVDIKLMVDFIVGSFRVNPRNATSYQFTLLFQGNITYKLVLTKALLQLAREGAALPWHPTLSTFYGVISKSLRKLLQDVVNFMNTEATKVLPVEKKEVVRKQSTMGPVVQETPHSLDCLLNLLTLFYTDPKMLLYPAPTDKPNEPNVEHKTQVLYAFGVLCKCLEEKQHFRVQNQAYKLLLKLFNTKYIQYWFPGDLITGFIEVSSQVLSSLSASLLESKDLQGRLLKTNLDLIKELTYASNKFIAKNKDKITQEHVKNRKRISAFKNLEKNLLTLLCSPDIEVWQTSASCFADICDQIDVLGDLEDKKNSIALNYNLYRKLSSVEDLGKSPMQQQLGIRTILRNTNQTDANLTTFLEVKTKWKDIKKNLIANIKDPNDPEGLDKSRVIWKNYTEFLVSLGGICMKSEEEKESGKIDRVEKGRKLATELISEVIEIMIVSSKNNTHVATMKNDLTTILGNELHSALYGLLFEQFHKQVSTFFNEDGSLQTSAESTQFVEKAIQISKMLIEVTQKGALDMESVDFETLVTSFIRYCNYLPQTDKAVEPIKTSICTLVTTLIDKRDIFKFKNDISFRTQTMNQITEWTSDFVHKLSEQKDTETFNREKEYPLDISCMTAISSLLLDLPFKEYKDFLKLFGFFIRYLHTCANDTSQLAVKLRQITVIALGHLLESNFNFGLDQFLKYIYIERKETVRTSFLDVLTNITKKGISLQEEKVEKKDIYAHLYDLLVEDNMSFTMLLLNVVPVQDQDNLCNALMRIFELNNRALDLLRLSIDLEVSATFDKNTLFRANSSASKMLIAYIKYSSKAYMNNSLGTLVSRICSNASRFEVDERRVKDGEVLEENIANLEQTCRTFLDCIQLYVDDIPYKVRMILNHLWKKVDSKFAIVETDQHASRHIVVGAVIFLRFLCPAIVSPQTNGLVDSKPDEGAARALMLITKVLQNVANGVPFGQKEASMLPLNKFITEQLPIIRQFFDDLAQLPEVGDESVVIIHPSSEEKKEDWETSYRFIYKAFDDVKKKIEETKGNLAVIGTVNQIMTELGKPSEEVKEQTMYISKEYKSAEMTKFMQPFETQDLSEFFNKQFCYTAGQSVEKQPVMYFICRQFYEGRKRGPEEIQDACIYVILKQLQSIFTLPYEVVIDCTGWNQIIKEGYLLKILTLLPVGARKNCAQVIFYNANSHTAKQFAKIGKFTMLSKKLFRKFIFVAGPKELYAQVDEKNNYLPETTMKYDADVSNTFGRSALSIKGDPSSKPLANIKINYSYLFVIGDDKIGGMAGRIVDFFPLIGLQQVTLDNDTTVSFSYVSSNQDRRFSIKIENAPTLFETIMKGIQRIKSDLALSNSMAGDPSASKESIKTSDVPGAMLNMCFLSLESNNPKTRTAAYNLLVALAEQFSFPVTVMENKDLCVPHNTNDLVVVLSNQVAKAKQGLTISFLKAALKGYNLYTKSARPSLNRSSAKIDVHEEDEGLAVPYKYLALKYMKPWIPNVAPFYEEHHDNPEEISRVKEWFSDLTTTTINDRDIYPALLNEVWSEISKDPSLVKLAIESVMAQGIEKGIGKEGDILGDLVVTLASTTQSAKFVVITILDAILAAIEETKEDSQETNWEKITVLCRYLLMLSFQNRINVNDNLSTLLYIIALAAGKSSYVLRATLHGLTMNLMHSLCTSHKMNNEIKKQMQALLHDLTTSEYKELFMESGTAVIDPYSTFIKEKSKPVEIDMWKHEKLVLFLTKIITTCFKLEPTTKKRYFHEWNVLIQQSSSKANHETVPRLMVIYGVLANNYIVKDSIPFIFNMLNSSLFQAQRKDIPVSTLLCMSQFCSKVQPDDDTLKVLFVVALILFGGADEKLFNAALHLFKSTLIQISQGNQYKQCATFEEYFKKYIRTEKNEPFIADLEKTTQMSFNTHFSFALSAFLVRGLTSNPTTREKTSDVFVTLLEVSKKLNNKIPDLLGYISSLIPFNYDKIHQVMGTDFVFYSEENFSHKLAPVLFTRFLMAIVQSVSDFLNPALEDNFELKKVMIFKVIQEVFEKIPVPFYPIFSEVLQRTITYYKTSCSVNQKKLAEVTLQLINTLMLNPEAALKESPSTLKEISFTGIDRLRSFTTTTVSLSKPTFTVLSDFLKHIIGSAPVDALPNEQNYQLHRQQQETPLPHIDKEEDLNIDAPLVDL